jgi:hypothetical protein
MAAEQLGVVDWDCWWKVGLAIMLRLVNADGVATSDRCVIHVQSLWSCCGVVLAMMRAASNGCTLLSTQSAVENLLSVNCPSSLMAPVAQCALACNTSTSCRPTPTTTQ